MSSGLDVSFEKVPIHVFCPKLTIIIIIII